LSFPVVDKTSNNCIGVVDIMDIALYLVESFPSVESINNDVLTKLEYNGRKFLTETSVTQVIAYSRTWNQGDLPVFPFKLNTPLLQLMNTFSFGIHRVPVINDNNKILNFISQMDLLRFLTQNIYLLDERGIGKKTLDELGIGRSSVLFVRADAMVLLTMKCMIAKKVSAMPVLDKDTGRLIANFSVSDLRGLGPNELPHLLRPLIEFLSIFNVKSLYPLTCKPTDTLEYVMLKLAATNVHRLWVVDSQQRLIGVVSLTDVMCPFLGVQPMEISIGTPPSIMSYIGGFVAIPKSQ